MIVYIPRYSRALIRRHPDVTFVFGDNLARVGKGGQAYETRGEPNTVGIPTKRSPDLFLRDSDIEVVVPLWRDQFHELFASNVAGKIIVWPLDGIGTGLANLSETAPACWAELQDLCKRYGIRNPA